MSQRVDFIQLDSQKVKMVSQVYSSFFSQQQSNKKKKGERILEQGYNENAFDKTQHKLIKILEHLKSSISPSADKQRLMEQKMCKILQHFMNRDEDMAQRQIQKLQGDIKTNMHLFINCYFYQTIPLDHKHNQPFGSYYDAVIKPQTAIAQIQQKFNHLPSAQFDFFYALHCEIIRLKQQSNKFQRFKTGKSQKQIINLAKAESILDETNQKNRAIQEKNNLLIKIDKIKNILLEMSQLQENMSQQEKCNTIRKSIEESTQEFHLPLRKIYSNILDLSKKWVQKQGQSPTKTLLSEMKNQNSSLKKHKQYLESQNQSLKKKIGELETQISSRSHQIYEKPSSKKEEEMRLKIRRLEQSENILRKQVKQYEEKLQQNKYLSHKANQLNLRIIQNQEAYKRESEDIAQNLQLARHSLRFFSEQKQQQKEEYTKLQQKSTQLKQEVAELRNQIIILKQQAVTHLSQPSSPDSSKEQIINNLRVNQKNQKKNYDRLNELYQRQRNQRQEVDLITTKMRQSYQSSQNAIKKLQEQIEEYKIRLQQKQVVGREKPAFDRMDMHRTHEQDERINVSSHEECEGIVGQKKVLNQNLDESKFRDAKYQQKVDPLQIKLSEYIQQLPKSG